MSLTKTSIQIGDWTFDHVSVDRDADVVYLSIGVPRPARSEETPEGHLLRYDLESGELCGITLISPNAILHDRQDLQITIPTRDHVPTAELRELVAC